MKIEKWTDEYVKFSDGSMITYDHQQDCCEYNYADFTVLDIFYNGEEFEDYRIEPVKYGANLVLIFRSDWKFGKFGYWETKSIYIPFYSDQNGYYTSELCIIVKGKDEVVIGPMEGYWVPETREDGENHVSESIEKGELENYSVVFCKACKKTMVCKTQEEAESALSHHLEAENAKISQPLTARVATANRCMKFYIIEKVTVDECQ